MTFLRPILLLVASVSFGLGISLPLIHFERFIFFSETPSLLQVIASLWQREEFALCAIVGGFSLVFPVVKLFTVFEAAFGSGRFPEWVGALAKWSMMDVLLVAILVVAAKTSGLAAAVSQPGIWFYALSTVCAAAATAGLGGSDAVVREK